MKDYFLRCDSRLTLEQALVEVGFLIEQDGELVPTVVIDYVGTLYRPTGVMLLDADGYEYPETRPVEGYHANLRAALTTEQEDLLPIIDAPNNPHRIFAGGIL